MIIRQPYIMLQLSAKVCIYHNKMCARVGLVLHMVHYYVSYNIHALS